MNKRILAIDDQQDVLLLLERIVTEETDYRITTCSDPREAIERFRAKPYDLVLTDLRMPGLNGLEVLAEIKRIDRDVPVVILTAYATIDNAVEAVRRGAHDYLTKPFRSERILVMLEKIMAWRRLESENRELRSTLEERNDVELIGGTPPLRDLLDRARQAAPTLATVLITGPSGSGKELLAREIHRRSGRRRDGLVTVNCAAIPEQVLESELFGHVKGAFTGAYQDKRGLVEAARGGTLFLDEIGDLGPQLQTKLLRLLQEGEFRPVGSVQTQQADLRFMAATNRNLKDAIRNGEFREDLYYRLDVVHLEMPALRERRADIPILAQHFLLKHARRHGKPQIHDISPAALKALRGYDFPGNVRELENVVERAVVFCIGSTIDVRDLRLDDDVDALAEPEPASAADTGDLSFREARDRALGVFHRRYLERILEDTGGNVSRAAELAGIQRQYLHRLMKEAGIEADDYRPGS